MREHMYHYNIVDIHVKQTHMQYCGHSYVQNDTICSYSQIFQLYEGCSEIIKKTLGFW